MADQTPAVREDWSGAKDKIRDMLDELKTFDVIAKELRPAPQHVVKKLFDEVLLEYGCDIDNPNDVRGLMRMKAEDSIWLEGIARLSVLKYQASCTPKRPSGRPILLNIALSAKAQKRRIWGADAPERHETRVISQKPEVDKDEQRNFLSDQRRQELLLELARREHQLRCEAANADRVRSKGVWGQLELPGPPVSSDQPSDGSDGWTAEEADGPRPSASREADG